MIEYNADAEARTLEEVIIDTETSGIKIINVIVTAWYKGYRAEGNTVTQIAYKTIILSS